MNRLSMTHSVSHEYGYGIDTVVGVSVAMDVGVMGGVVGAGAGVGSADGRLLVQQSNTKFRSHELSASVRVAVRYLF